MPKLPETPFTHAHQLQNDDSIAFQCSSDLRHWPWLALHPFNPILVQTINFWASIETAMTRGTFDPNKWSALTQTEWTCGALGTGTPTHGIAQAGTDADPTMYRLTFFDGQDRLVCRMSGHGVVFQNRDFESWRGAAKHDIASIAMPANFLYASRELLDASSDIECFLSPLQDDDDQLHATALITKYNGLPPAHPYHSGSGDHVNSTHLADAAHQFINLLHQGAPVHCIGGEMQFHRYVELGSPFQVRMRDKAKSKSKNSPKEISLSVLQADRECTTINMRYLMA